MRESHWLHRLTLRTPADFLEDETNVYLLERNGEGWFIDAGFDDPNACQQILDYCHSLSVQDVHGILITHAHRDHAPGASLLAKHFRCPVFYHPLEKERMSSLCPVETMQDQMLFRPILKEGSVLQLQDLTLQIIHTPGHTSGHLAILVAEEGVLFAGDHIVEAGTTWIGPPDGDLAQYLHSLHRLKTLEIKQIAPGHGKLLNDPHKKIQMTIDRRLSREKELLEQLSAQFQSIPELTESIYQNRLQPNVKWFAEQTIWAHLIKLEQDGLVEELNQRWRKKESYAF